MKDIITDKLYKNVCTILKQARESAARAVNFSMVQAYWLIGKIIVEEEQKGMKRANYGEDLICGLSAKLKNDFGKGFSGSNLKNMRQFYLHFSKKNNLSLYLSWSHYCLLIKIEDISARQFYLKESEAARWSVRELERQMATLLYERLAASRKNKGVIKLARKGHEILSPGDLVKDPYVLEFLGLKKDALLYEKKLESVLIEHLQEFLLELGKGFAFIGRQQRITIDGDHFYVDLVFYNRIAKCFVLLDLKLGKLTHQDLGQMQMYLNYYKRTQKIEGENDPIGIVLCSEKNDTVVRFTLPEGQTEIFASKYELTLPTAKELQSEIRKERTLLETYGGMKKK